MKKNIGLASDHAGFQMKQFVKTFLEKKNLPYTDYGTYTEESCDYPDFAHKLAEGIEKKEVERGIAICGSGEGICMTLNKHAAIRAALVWDLEISRLTRMHNDANVLCLPGRFISEEKAAEIITNFLDTPFEGGRHIKRINKIPIKAQ